MDQATLEKIIIEHSTSHSGKGGVVEFEFLDINLAVISDKSHDRMRIITPITRYSDMTTGQIDAVMLANFHSALDARYAVSDGLLYSVFIHPMSSLNEGAIVDAMNQVANLALSFGSAYSSGKLLYGESSEEDGITL